MMAAFFMATDPVTSPMTAPGQLFYGTCAGILSGLFRVYGTGADSVSYAVILSNLAVPLIDEYIVPRPYSYRGSRNERALQIKEILIPAAVVCAALLVSAFAIGFVSGATESVIAERQLAENVAAYQEALPVAAEADAFGYPAQAVSALEALDGGVYGTDFGEARRAQRRCDFFRRVAFHPVDDPQRKQRGRPGRSHYAQRRPSPGRDDYGHCLHGDERDAGHRHKGGRTGV